MARIFDAVSGKIFRKDVRKKILNRLLYSIFKKALYWFIKNFCQTPKLNVRHCSCLILNSRNRATADIYRNSFQLYRELLLAHFLFGTESLHLLADHIHFFTVNNSRHFFTLRRLSEICVRIFRYRTNTKARFVLTQDN